MTIYAVENNLKNLLLIDDDGRTVVNGGYACTKHKDGSLTVPNSKLRAYYVMEAPKPKREPGVHYYNTVLAKADEIIAARQPSP